MKILEQKENVYVVINDVLTKVSVVELKPTEYGNVYYVEFKGTEEPIAIEPGTNFYKSESDFRDGIYISEIDARMLSRYIIKYEDNKCFLKMWGFNNGEPEEVNIFISRLDCRCNFLTPIISDEVKERYYLSREDCLKNNDYTIEEDGVKRVVKSIAKRLKLDEDQLQMVEELKSLLNKLDENGIKVIADWADSQTMFMNTRHLKDIQIDSETPIDYNESNLIDYSWLTKIHDMKLDVVCSDGDWNYYARLKD